MPHAKRSREGVLCHLRAVRESPFDFVHEVHPAVDFLDCHADALCGVVYGTGLDFAEADDGVARTNHTRLWIHPRLCVLLMLLNFFIFFFVSFFVFFFVAHSLQSFSAPLRKEGVWLFSDVKERP